MIRIVIVVFIVIVAIGVDSIFGFLAIPIVTMDLFFVPVGIATIIWVCTPKYFSGKYIDWHQIKSGNTMSKVLLISTSLVLTLLSIFMIYIGGSNPLELYIGVKGAGHGYSLLIIGLAILFFTVSTTYLCMFKKNA